MPKIGSIIDGTYKVLEVIGRGGQSIVYLVRNARANQQWACKEIKKEDTALVTDDKILKDLRHPNLPRIIDVYQTESTYLIIMDYIEGDTLRKVLREKGAQDESDVVKWGIQLCDVLSYLHSQDPPIIYRDMKPANVMLKKDGDIVLIDFGTARRYKENVSEDTSALGTRGYAAPEQFGGRGQTDQRTDIYNLGATLYHLVTGHNPNKPPYEIKPIRQWDASLSSGLEKIILKCTQDDPDMRYQTCEELKEDLLRYRELDNEYIRTRKIRRFAVSICLAFSILCFGASAFSFAGERRAVVSSYESIFMTAQATADQTARWEGYAKAARTKPDRMEPLLTLLSEMIRDGSLSKEDSEYMTDLLAGDIGGKTLMDAAAMSKDYGKFAYQMGLAYFYYYDVDGNKSLASPWFQAACSHGGLDETKAVRAERFAKVADYYARLGLKDKAGDDVISYRDYWDDMMALTQGDIFLEDNMQTAIIMYKELTSQAAMHAYDLRSAGVSYDEILSKLSDIGTRTSYMVSTQEYDPALDEDVDEIYANIDMAKAAIDAAYQM